MRDSKTDKPFKVNMSECNKIIELLNNFFSDKLHSGLVKNKLKDSIDKSGYLEITMLDKDTQGLRDTLEINLVIDDTYIASDVRYCNKYPNNTDFYKKCLDTNFNVLNKVLEDFQMTTIDVSYINYIEIPRQYQEAGVAGDHSKQYVVKYTFTLTRSD